MSSISNINPFNSQIENDMSAIIQLSATCCTARWKQSDPRRFANQTLARTCFHLFPNAVLLTLILRLLQDTFFYCLVFDPTQKTLLADKGEIRVGSRYQTEVTHLMKEGETDGRVIDELESLVWTPTHSLTDRKIDQFLVVSRSVGTFARALDCGSSVKQPSLHMSAAAASRDITLVCFVFVRFTRQ